MFPCRRSSCPRKDASPETGYVNHATKIHIPRGCRPGRARADPERGPCCRLLGRIRPEVVAAGTEEPLQGAPSWAGNASAATCDGACLGDQTRDQDRTQLRDGTCLTNQVCDGDQDRARVRDRTRLNQTAPSENGKRFALQGRLQRGQGR